MAVGAGAAPPILVDALVAAEPETGLAAIDAVAKEKGPFGAVRTSGKEEQLGRHGRLLSV